MQEHIGYKSKMLRDSISIRLHWKGSLTKQSTFFRVKTWSGSLTRFFLTCARACLLFFPLIYSILLLITSVCLWELILKQSLYGKYRYFSIDPINTTTYTRSDMLYLAYWTAMYRASSEVACPLCACSPASCLLACSWSCSLHMQEPTRLC